MPFFLYVLCLRLSSLADRPLIYLAMSMLNAIQVSTFFGGTDSLTAIQFQLKLQATFLRLFSSLCVVEGLAAWHQGLMPHAKVI